MEITEKTAQLAKQPTGREDLTGWVLEPKYDGWRMLIEVQEGGILWVGRSGLTYNGHTPHLDKILQKLPVGTVLDGELIHPQGWRKAQEIMGSEDRQSEDLEYILFDILQAGTQEGLVDMQSKPLKERRRVLEVLYGLWIEEELPAKIALAPQNPYSDRAVRMLIQEGWEGGVVKDPNSTYQGGRRSTWLKFKAQWTEDVVVTGGIAGKGEIEGQVGSLTIAQYKDGELVPLGRTWGKFSHEERQRLTELWKNDQLFGLVAEITVMGFTNKGKFRSPVIQRFRTDKLPEQCEYTAKDDIYAL